MLPLSLHSRAVRVNACRGTPILAAKSAKSIHISKMAGVGMRQTRDSQMEKKRRRSSAKGCGNAREFKTKNLSEERFLAGRTRLELATSGVTGRCSNQN